MFNEKRYVWNYLFNGLFEWFSLVNYPEEFAILSDKKAPNQEVRKLLSARFDRFVVIHRYDELFYLLCVESVGLDKNNPLGLFKDYQDWKLTKGGYLASTPAYYLKDKEQPGYNLGSFSYLNSHIKPFDLRFYTHSYKGHRPTEDLDLLLTQVKKNFPTLMMEGSPRDILLRSREVSFLRKEAYEHPERVLDVSNPEKLAEEWFRFQERKNDYGKDDTE